MDTQIEQNLWVAVLDLTRSILAVSWLVIIPVDELMCFGSVFPIVFPKISINKSQLT